MINLIIVGCICIGIGILCCIPKMRKVNIDKKQQEKEFSDLKIEINNLTKIKKDLEENYLQQNTNYQTLLTQYAMQQNALDTLEEQNKNASEKFYKQFMDNIQLRIDTETEKLGQQIQTAKDEYEQDYLQVLAEASQELNESIKTKREEVDKLTEDLQNLKDKRTAIIEAFKREEETKLEQDKYKIILSKEDLNEINRLREVAPFLRNARPVYKIIWEGYYRDSTSDLLLRIIGDNKISGIYLITNTSNNRTYVGQSVNISERFKQHIKSGLGIDTPNNILYKAMLEDGVENFTFELLESVEQNKLNEREKYWIDFYQSDKYGYNMTAGGAKK